MATTKVLALTVEQAEELVNGIYSEEIVSVEGSQSTSFFQKVRQSLRNKFGKSASQKTPEETETVTLLVKDPEQVVDNVKTEVQQMENAAPKKMSDHEYRCYLNSVVFGE